MFLQVINARPATPCTRVIRGIEKRKQQKASVQLLRAEDKWIPGVPIVAEETLNNN